MVEAPEAKAAEFDEAGSPLLDQSDGAFYTGLAVVLLSLVSALATYLILTGLTPITPRNEVVLGALFVNVLLILAMVAVIAWQISGLWRAWRLRIAGARLHVRIVALFSIIAALPAILLAVAATTTFSRSLDSWFSERTRAIIDSSIDVANAYLEEHGQVIRNDIVNMARDIDAAAGQVRGDSTILEQLLAAQAGLRDLTVAYIIDRNGNLVLSAFEDSKIPFRVLPQRTLAQAETGQTPLLTQSDDHRVLAVTKLQNYPGWFLSVGRGVSPQVMGHLRSTRQNVSDYETLRNAQGGLTIAHGLMYMTISMTGLLAAIWTGLWFAGRFVAPIRRLIGAAQQVSKGNLNLLLPERRGEGDLRRLSRTFNHMTRDLRTQRETLMAANEQLLERRRFMEAVLSGVSAGVIGLDAQRRITIASQSAETLLGIREANLIGQPLASAVPAFAALMDRRGDHALKRRGSQNQVTLAVDGDERVFAVRVTQEGAGEGDRGSVVTFDDVTELVSAQRTSAWADVARRIAHEIKNPLTPIILSAERIRRKYGKVIIEDRETFDKLTSTIERQAGDIKTMVDEFASFARVSKPVIEEHDAREVVQGPMILFRESHPAIGYRLDVPKAPVLMFFDRRLITQAVTNLIKNATEAVEAAAEASTEKGWRGQVEIVVRPAPDRVEIEVIDNGVGLPKQNRARLLEPYVTTRSKGTGLGLAIVQKITEQHNGTLELADAPGTPGRARGALVRMTLPLLARSVDTVEPLSGDASPEPFEAHA